jgi:hypothetical protein
VRLTLPSRVLSADERMKRMDPLDIFVVVWGAEIWLRVRDVRCRMYRMDYIYLSYL